MNERIKKLLNVCGMPNEDLMEIYSDTNKTFYMEQFAELIVRECMNLTEGCRDKYLNSAPYKIAKHFGVE